MKESKIGLKVKRYHKALFEECERHYFEMEWLRKMWDTPADELIKDDDPGLANENLH